MDSIKSTTPCDDLGALCVWCWCERGAELLLGCCCHRGAQCVPERGWIEFTPAWTALDSWPLLLLKKLVRGLWSSPFWSSVGPAVLRRPHMCLCVCVCGGIPHLGRAGKPGWAAGCAIPPIPTSIPRSPSEMFPAGGTREGQHLFTTRVLSMAPPGRAVVNG